MSYDINRAEIFFSCARHLNEQYKIKLTDHSITSVKLPPTYEEIEEFASKVLSFNDG